MNKFTTATNSALIFGIYSFKVSLIFEVYIIECFNSLLGFNIIYSSVEYSLTKQQVYRDHKASGTLFTRSPWQWLQSNCSCISVRSLILSRFSAFIEQRYLTGHTHNNLCPISSLSLAVSTVAYSSESCQQRKTTTFCPALKSTPRKSPKITELRPSSTAIYQVVIGPQSPALWFVGRKISGHLKGYVTFSSRHLEATVSAPSVGCDAARQFIVLLINPNLCLDLISLALWRKKDYALQKTTGRHGQL